MVALLDVDGIHALLLTRIRRSRWAGSTTVAALLRRVGFDSQLEPGQNYRHSQ